MSSLVWRCKNGICENVDIFGVLWDYVGNECGKKCVLEIRVEYWGGSIS